MPEDSLAAQNYERLQAARLEQVDLVELFEAGSPALIEAFPHVHPDLETQFISRNLDLDPLSYRGVDGFVEGWRDWLGPWKSYKETARGILAPPNGDLVAGGDARGRNARGG